MPADQILMEKIGLLFKDMDKMSVPDKIKTVERFIRAQLKLQDTPHVIDYNALFLMTSRAKSIARDIPTNMSMNGHLLHHDPELFRMVCYFNTVYEYMRSQNMTPFLVKLKTDENR